MRGFFEALLFFYSITITYVSYLFYRRLKKKVSKDDIENYLLDNFLDIDL